MNRISEGVIKVIMPAETKEIKSDGVVVVHEGEELFVPADFVFILTGFTPNYELFAQWGLKPHPVTLELSLTKAYESEREGVFVLGSAGFGVRTNAVFIENGREHAKIAVQEIFNRVKQPEYTKVTEPLELGLKDKRE